MTDIKHLLHSVPLFAQLTDEQLYWLLEHGHEIRVQPSEVFVAEGTPPSSFFVLLEGNIEVKKKLGKQDVHILTFAPGAFLGHELLFLDTPWLASCHALTALHLFRVEKEAFWEMLVFCPSIARELFTTLAQRVQNMETVSQGHAKLTALGTLSAGLAHELNNPTAAVSRGVKNLDEIFQQLPSLWLKLNQQQMTTEQLVFVATLQHDAAEQTKIASQLDALTQSDREDEVIAWLLSHGVVDGWKLAPTMVGAGLDSQKLDNIVEQLAPNSLNDVLVWLTVTLTGVGLLNEIQHGSSRISKLVKAMKEYSYMDQAPLQEINVHDGLESTLTILNHKLKQGVNVIREYDQRLPRFCAYGSELNQV